MASPIQELQERVEQLEADLLAQTKRADKYELRLDELKVRLRLLFKETKRVL